MSTPKDFGISPEILDQITATGRTVEPLLTLLDNMQPVMDIIERQQTAMEAMRRSFEIAMQAQPPPQTRQALADLVHLLQSQSLTATLPTLPPPDAEQALIALLPRTPEETDEVTQNIAQIEADPELSGELRRVVDDWAELRKELRKWTPWAVLAWLAWRLSDLADSPVTEHLSAAQTAVVQNRIMVLALLAALAQIILTRGSSE